MSQSRSEAAWVWGICTSLPATFILSFALPNIARTCSGDWCAALGGTYPSPNVGAATFWGVGLGLLSAGVVRLYYALFDPDGEEKRRVEQLEAYKRGMAARDDANRQDPPAF